MSRRGWAVKETEEGGEFVVTWNGTEWGMEPRTLPSATAYLDRLKERYPEGGDWLVHGAEHTRIRGGPWRYLLANGETEVIHTSRLNDAKDVLRHRLRRKTLPRGTTWELVLD